MSFMIKLGYKNKFHKMDDEFAKKKTSELKTYIMTQLKMPNDINYKKYFYWMDALQDEIEEPKFDSYYIATLCSQGVVNI